MYVRFVIDELDEDSNQRTGVFQAIRLMKKEDCFCSYELDYIEEVMNWFDENLESPFDYLNKHRLRKSGVSISWFKETAHEHIEKVREFVHILENNGVVVDMIVTNNPGKIIYSDEFQIFANPYRKF